MGRISNTRRIECVLRSLTKVEIGSTLIICELDGLRCIHLGYKGGTGTGFDFGVNFDAVCWVFGGEASENNDRY